MKVILNNSELKEEYNLLETTPTPPYANVNNQFLKLCINGNSKFKINGLFIFKEQNQFLYVADVENILHKINSNDGQEVWNYNIGKEIKSIAINNNYIYVKTQNTIEKLDTNKKYISTINIIGNSLIIDNNTFYVANGKTISKLDNNFKEVATYNTSSNIKSLCCDSKGNIFINTNTEVIKIKNDFKTNPASKNLLPPFTSNYWTNYSSIKLNNTSFNNNQGNFDISTIQKCNISNYKELTLSFKYISGNQICFMVTLYDKSGNIISNANINNMQYWYTFNAYYTNINTSPFTFEVPSNAVNSIFYFDSNNDNTNYSIEDVQLQPGSVSTMYLPQGENVKNYEWAYPIKNVNSTAVDTEDNLYISTNQNVQELNTNGQNIDTLNIQANKIAFDKENNMYISYDKNLEKLSKKMIIEWKYIDNSNINNLIT